MSRPLEVLHVIETLGEGGAEQNLLSFLKHLPQDRYRHHMAWMFDDVTMLERFRPHVASFIPLSAGHGARLAGAIWRLARAMKRIQPDVVHTQLIRSQIAARAASLLAGRPPVVTTWQAPYYDPYALSDFAGSERRRAVVRLLDRVTSHVDRGFIAVSQHVADHCRQQLGISTSRVRVIYNAVEPSRYAKADAAAVEKTRAALGLSSDARVLLSVGRLVGQKAQCDLIAAMPRVLARVPEAVLLIAGGGPLMADLAEQTRALGLQRSVKLLGPRKDVPVLYQLAHVFVFPSLYEGLSVAVLEALANGVPAVVSDIPQNREIADGFPGVRFVPVRQPNAIADAALELLAAHETSATALRAASASVQQRFSPDTLALQFGEALKQAALSG
jgi:glycosyltransferase involved in cell wall biosynthesis